MSCAVDAVAINVDGEEPGVSHLLSLTTRFSGEDDEGFYTEDKNSGAWTALK